MRTIAQVESPIRDWIDQTTTRVEECGRIGICTFGALRDAFVEMWRTPAAQLRTCHRESALLE